MSGAELASRLKVEKLGLKVIYSSGYSLDMVNGGLLLEGNSSYLPKPYNAAKLVSTVRKCLDG